MGPAIAEVAVDENLSWIHPNSAVSPPKTNVITSRKRRSGWPSTGVEVLGLATGGVARIRTSIVPATLEHLLEQNISAASISRTGKRIQISRIAYEQTLLWPSRRRKNSVGKAAVRKVGPILLIAQSLRWEDAGRRP